MSRIAIIGAGPRGLSLAERLVANAAAMNVPDRLEVILVDPCPPGAGRVWRTDQSPHLIMNTPAGACTIFTDRSVTCDGPVVEGPTLSEWASTIAPNLNLPASIATMAKRTKASDFAPRALFGQYLAWAFEEVRARAPNHISIRHVSGRAARVEKDGARWRIGLSDGSVIDDSDSVLVACGHPEIPPSPARTPGRLRFPPGNAADARLESIEPEETVAIRGMGLCAFDYLSLLSEGRGGTFVRGSGSALNYIASGQEPKILIGSRRGFPYRGRAIVEPAETYLPVVLTKQLQARLEKIPVIDFSRDLWPPIAQELIAACQGTLNANIGDVSADALSLLERISDPLTGREFPSAESLSQEIVELLKNDLADGADPTSRLYRLRSALRATRTTLRENLSLRPVTAESRGPAVERLRELVDFAISGPPASRIEEMLALHRVGILDFIGPDMIVKETATGYDVSSQRVASSTRRATVLIDAWMPNHGLRGAAQLADGDDHWDVTSEGAVSVRNNDLTILDRGGVPIEGCHALGIPIAPQDWVPVIAPLRGSDSRFLRMTDRVARAVLARIASQTHTNNRELQHAH